ncbi:MAG: substrate-binding domain-containing protein [Lachnospiraceae bacterium]
MKKKMSLMLAALLVLLLCTGCASRSIVETEQAQASRLDSKVETTQAEESTQQAATQEIPISIDTDLPVKAGAKMIVVAKSKTGVYWETLRTYMKEAVAAVNEAYGYTGSDKITVTFEAPTDASAVDDQINIIDLALAENPAVLCVSPIDKESCQAQLDTARDNGISVILFESGLDDADEYTYTGTDNQAAGALAAEYLTKAVGETGTVAVLASQSLSLNTELRLTGFEEKAAKMCPETTVLSLQGAQEDLTFEESLEEFFSKHPDIDGVFCTDEAAANAVLAFVQANPEYEIEIVGFDVGSTQLEAVKSGEELGIFVQDLRKIAYETIYVAATSATTDTSVDASVEDTQILTDAIWVDADSLEDAEVAQYLYE